MIKQKIAFGGVRGYACVALLLTSGLAAAQGCAGDAAFGVHNERIVVTKKEAADYKPGARNYYVREYNDGENIYLMMAVSASRRQEFLGRWKDPEFVKCMNTALDELGVIARKTLPTYRPSGFPIRNAAEEQILKGGVSELAKGTVFGGGFASAAWSIQKNRNDLPVARYKHGMIYARIPGVDDGFCRVFHINLVQDYSGGGTYNASKGKLVRTEFASCP